MFHNESGAKIAFQYIFNFSGAAMRSHRVSKIKTAVAHVMAWHEVEAFMFGGELRGTLKTIVNSFGCRDTVARYVYARAAIQSVNDFSCSCK